MAGVRVVGLVLLALVAAALAGCSRVPAVQQSAATSSPPPMSGSVSARAQCGVRQVFWQGHWWVAGGQPVFATGSMPWRPVTPVHGAIVETGPGRASFTSPALPRPVELAASSDQRPDQPPLGACVQ